MNQFNEGVISSGLVPVVIGVTGHRDIPDSDIDKLAEATRKVIEEIDDSSPNSPHVLLSSLAEGADRIAARCALNLGWTLVVVLPSSADIYERDFLTQQSKHEFRELFVLARSVCWSFWIWCIYPLTICLKRGLLDSATVRRMLPINSIPFEVESARFHHARRFK